ncbi:MAG: response regulator, partial [Chitinophagales bacterium]
MNNPEVLIIDDELPICKLLVITLESSDYKTIVANSAKEGLIKAANHPPDIILLDLGLPDASGHEVLKQLREWYNKPIIILSVQSEESDIVLA